MKKLLLIAAVILMSVNAFAIHNPFWDRPIQSAEMTVLSQKGIFNVLHVKAPVYKLTMTKKDIPYPSKIQISSPGICTADVNQWGHPSACSCNDGYNYNKRTGNCEGKKMKKNTVYGFILDKDGSKTRYEIYSVETNGCGAVTYKGKVQKVDLHHLPHRVKAVRSIEVTDHSNMRCRYAVRYNWDVKVKQTLRGYQQGFMRLGGNPNPVYTIQSAN
jgi:hypothetical protein